MAQTKEIFALEYKFGGNTEFLTKIENLLNRMEKSFSATELKAEKAGDGIKQAFDGVDKSINRAEKSTKKLEGSLAGVGSKLKGLAAGFVGFKTVEKAISVFSERENLQTNIGTLLGSDTQGKAFSDYITKFAAATPYGISELSSLAKGLIQYDVPLEDVKKYMSQVGDIAMGDRSKMGSLGVVLGQVASAGKLQGQDLMQFINAGFNPLTEMSKMTGKSMAELRDIMSQGGISFQMVADAMARATSEGGKFYKGMEKGARTLSGKWSTAMDNIEQKLGDAVERNSDKLKQFVDRVGNLNLDAIIDSASRIGNAVLNTAEKLTPLVEKLMQIPGLMEAIFASMAIEKLSAFTGGIFNLSGAFGHMEKSLRRANRELLTMGRNGKTAAMGVASAMAGATAGFMGGAQTSGEVVANGLAAGATAFAMTGTPLVGLLVAGGSFVGSTANAAYQAATYDYEGDEESIAANSKLNELNLKLKKAYKAYQKNGSAKNRAAWAEAEMAYIGEYGTAAYMERMNVLRGGGAAESAEAKSSVTNNYNTTNNSVTQNNSISAEFSELGNLLRKNLVEVLERDIRFDSSMAMEVAAT